MLKLFLTLACLAPSVLCSQLNYRSELFERQGTCSAGKVACGTGCIPSNTECCGTYYCSNGRSCDPNGSCTCLANEKQCGTSCIPATASCCPLDLRYCSAGLFCAPVKGYCCKNVRGRVETYSGITANKNIRARIQQRVLYVKDL
jgi:hypothetical protein